MTKTRILVVEDEAIVARDISLQLERSGYIRAAVTPRGEDAITLAGELRPDLVLMDIQLAGDLDGITTAMRIRELYAIPVVFLTAFADEAVLERARSAGAFGYIIKPFEERELQPTIEIALHKHRAEENLRQSEDRFRRLFNGMRDAVLLADAETGLVLEANDEACRLFDRPRSELVGTHQKALHPRDEEQRYLTLFADHAACVTTMQIEAEICTAQGRVVPVEINAGPFDLGGGRQAVLGVFRDVSARHASERALREHQARLDSIFRVAPTGIGILRERVFVEVNSHVSLMTGYSREELLGRSARMLYASDEEFEAVGREKYRQIREQGTGTVETRWKHRDGHMLDVLLSSAPIVADDLSSGVTFTAIDITERKGIRAELARRNRVLEGLQRISHTLLDAAPGTGAYDRISQEVASMLDVRHAAVLHHQPSSDNFRIAGLTESGESIARPSHITLQTSLVHDILDQARPAHTSDPAQIAAILEAGIPWLGAQVIAGAPLVIDGRVGGILVVGHDEPSSLESSAIAQLSSIADHIAGQIERREARAAQVRSETELLAIYDHAPMIICLLDENARIIRANQTAARFAERDAGELLGTRGGEFLSCLGALDDSRGCGFGQDCGSCRLRTTVADTLRTGRSTAQVEVTKTVHRRGIARELHMMLSTARLDLDGKRRILIVLEDITENRRLTEHLMRAQRMESIGTLASGIAHDLNNVLAPIVMCLSMLRDTTKDRDVLELIESMQISAQRGADIVRQVLTFARGLGGEQVEIQPKHVVQETARIARETFPRAIDVAYDFGRDLPTILGDPTQIQQVLMNLCVNARDAMPTGGSLSIRVDNATETPPDALPAAASRQGRFIVLTVTDTGSGIPLEVRERIFDPFFTTKPVGKGTGLGLAVSLGIIDKHGGCIHVSSLPGAGTTFRVFLPASDASRPRPPADRLEERLPRGHEECILIVDDEVGVRKVMAGMLQKLGFTVLVARDGNEALEKISTPGAGVRLVVADLMMHGMDGLELIPRVRERWPEMPIIAMTGIGDDEVREAATNAGAHQILAKPFSREALLRTVHQLLSPGG